MEELEGQFSALPPWVRLSGLIASKSLCTLSHLAGPFKGHFGQSFFFLCLYTIVLSVTHHDRPGVKLSTCHILVVLNFRQFVFQIWRLGVFGL